MIRIVTFNYIPTTDITTIIMMSRFQLLLALLLCSLHTIDGFNTQTISPLTLRGSTQRPYGCYLSTKDKQKETPSSIVTNGGEEPEITLINGSPSEKEQSQLGSDDSIVQDYNVTLVMDQISKKINDGSLDIMQNITKIMDEKFESVALTESSAQEMSEYITDLVNKINKAQQQELQRQLEELEKLFLEPFEQIAFSDAPLFDIESNVPTEEEIEKNEKEDKKVKLILAGKNSTVAKSSRMKTSEIVKNFNVAPLYYSAALLIRYARKASYPSIWVLSAYKGIGNIFKSSGPRRRRRKKKGELSYEEYIKDAEAMQSSWKRTGEIAAKGKYSRKWAILRRSLEVWVYFSSFYLKDRRIAKKFESGRWSEERFKEERSKLGAEITQNLLRLGPTFIKVCRFQCTNVIIQFALFACV